VTSSYSKAHVPAVSRVRVSLVGGGFDDNGRSEVDRARQVRGGVVDEEMTGRRQNDAHALDEHYSERFLVCPMPCTHRRIMRT
jgi:hypothetical protein